MEEKMNCEDLNLRLFIIETKMENFEKRNEDFFKLVCRMQAEGCPGRSSTSLQWAVRRALQEPAPSFYLTREHVWKQLQRRKRRLPPREKPHRRQMWEEIERGLRERLREKPREDAWVALDHVLTETRPSGFFLTEEYALKLVYNMLQQRRERGREIVNALKETKEKRIKR